MIARTHTISSSVKPRSAPSLIFCTSHVLDRNIGRDAGAAFLAIGAVGHNLVGPALARGAIDIGVAPGIGGDAAALEIRSVPGCDTGCRLHQGRQAFLRRWKPAGIKIEQIERAAEALQ